MMMATSVGVQFKCSVVGINDARNDTIEGKYLRINNFKDFIVKSINPYFMQMTKFVCCTRLNDRMK